MGTGAETGDTEVKVSLEDETETLPPNEVIYYQPTPHNILEERRPS